MNRLNIPLTVALAAVFGCTDSEQHKPGAIGKSIGKSVTEFAQGVGTGVDDQLQIKIELSELMTQKGISATVAKQQSSLDGPEKSITVYFMATAALQGSITAKAFNAEGLEIGRATTDVEFEADDAQYVSFSFPTEMDRQTVAVYKIDLRKPVTESPDASDSP